MLAERITFPSNPSAELSPFPTHCSELFVTARNLKSFGIKKIHTLSAKHPGVGGSPEVHLVLPCAAYRFLCPFLSWPYKSLFPQPLSFHIHTNPGGCASRPGRLQTENVYREVLGLLTGSHLSTRLNQATNVVRPRCEQKQPLTSTASRK